MYIFFSIRIKVCFKKQRNKQRFIQVKSLFLSPVKLGSSWLLGLWLALFCSFIILHRWLLSHGPKQLPRSSHLITFQPAREEKGLRWNNPLFKGPFLKVVYMAYTYTILTGTQSQCHPSFKGRWGTYSLFWVSLAAMRKFLSHLWMQEI